MLGSQGSPRRSHIDHTGALAYVADRIVGSEAVTLSEPVGPAVRFTSVPKGDRAMLDVLYIGLVLGFLALSWGLVALCDRL